MTTLILNEEEVAWLKGIIQNPMWVDHPDDEDPKDKRMREAFWNALGGNKIPVPFTGSTPSGASCGPPGHQVEFSFSKYKG